MVIVHFNNKLIAYVNAGIDLGLASRRQSAMQSTTPKFFSRSHDAVIRVYDEAGNIIETHEQPGDFRILFYSST
jgi:hypothetical protein